MLRAAVDMAVPQSGTADYQSQRERSLAEAVVAWLSDTQQFGTVPEAFLYFVPSFQVAGCGFQDALGHFPRTLHT